MVLEYVCFTVTYTHHHSEAPEPPRPFLHLRRHEVANNINEREEVERPHVPVARRARGPEVLDAGADIMPLVSHILHFGLRLDVRRVHCGPVHRSGAGPLQVIPVQSQSHAATEAQAFALHLGALVHIEKLSPRLLRNSSFAERVQVRLIMKRWDALPLSAF